MRNINLIIILFSLGLGLHAQSNPIELGKVSWIRNYDKAVALSTETGKPIFLLFQEVPGCSNCTRYGTEVLSNPDMVKVIGEDFIPLAIHNNKGGHDKDILKKFREPAWNNPVVRIINPQGEDLVPRIGDFRSYQLLIDSMKEAVHKTGRTPLPILEKLRLE